MIRVTIALSGDRFHSILAYVYGDWAVHSDGTPEGWRVTLLNSGRSANPISMSKAGARRAAAWLQRHITHDEILDWAELNESVKARIQQGIEIGADK